MGKSDKINSVIDYLRQHYPLCYWHYIGNEDGCLIFATTFDDTYERLSMVYNYSWLSEQALYDTTKFLGDMVYKARERKLAT